MGFTLLELMVVVALAAMLAAGLSFSLRDSSQQQLEREALRLGSLLDAARAQARTSGAPIVWRATAQGFEFIGASPRRDASESLTEPRAWLVPGTTARVTEPANAPVLVLGPEPLNPPQRLTLSLGERRLELASNGLRAFAPTSGLAAP
jgi:general secretion pathway protein H